jgi:glycerol kinase
MSDEVVLALDQGTTSSRTIAFDCQGRVVASAQREFAQHYPEPGWVEHDAVEIWESQRATYEEVLAVVGRERVAALGIANQRETTVVWDRKTGLPVHRAIVWQDRRTAAMCAQMKDDGMESEIGGKTGLRLDPYFSGTKLAWLMDHVPDLVGRAIDGELAFGTVDSWLVWNLTGGAVHATDASNASRTLLFDLHTGEWDRMLCELFGAAPGMLPEVRDSSGSFGETPEGIPIMGVAGDQQAALFGQECFRPGMAKNTYGTGCFLLMNTGAEAVESQHRLLTTVAWRLGGETTYALEGSVFTGGAVVQWLRDEMEMIGSSEECETLARTVGDTGGLVLVPAFTGLGAPHWNPEARGIAVGMTRGTGRAHFCRAALESIALQTGELLDCMRRDAGMELEVLRVDGGAARNDLLLQMQADLSGARVVRPACVETTARGAAALAGLAVGFWKDHEELAGMMDDGTSFEPSGVDVSDRWDRWRKAVRMCAGGQE